MRNPLARFALATFTGQHGTLKARVIFFRAAGFLDSEGPADPRIEGVKDRLIALSKVMDE